MGGNQINNLAPGIADTDAVNVGQLEEVEELAKSGIASVAAMASIPGPVPGKRFSVGGSIGSFESETAFAIGGHALFGQNWVVTASAATSSSHTAAGLGASFSW